MLGHLSPREDAQGLCGRSRHELSSRVLCASLVLTPEEFSFPFPIPERIGTPYDGGMGEDGRTTHGMSEAARELGISTEWFEAVLLPFDPELDWRRVREIIARVTATRASSRRTPRIADRKKSSSLVDGGSMR